MLKTANSTLTNQFFFMFLSIVIGPLIGRIKIKSFSLGMSGGIFIGTVIGYLTTRWAHTASESGVEYANAKRILSTGAAVQVPSTSFLLPLLVSIGLKMGNSIKTISKKYGMKFAVIGIPTPVVSVFVAYVLYGSVLFFNQSIIPFEIIGMYTGPMTTTLGYGTALDVAGHVDYGTLYGGASEEDKDKMLLKISPSGTLSRADTAALNEEQIVTYRETASSAISLGYTIIFSMGVLVIIAMLSAFSGPFRIGMEREKENYQKEMNEMSGGEKTAKKPPLSFMVMSLVTMIDTIVRSIAIPSDSPGSFLMEVAGGAFLVALILDYIGQIGPVNFRMGSKALGITYRMGPTLFMAAVGLCYGCDVVTSLMGSGLVFTMAAIFMEVTAVLVSFLIGYKLFGLSRITLNGTIVGGYTPAPGLGAAISSIDSEEPTAGYGAAQSFTIPANVLLATMSPNIML